MVCSAPGKGLSLDTERSMPGTPLPLLSPAYLGRNFKGKKVEAPGGQGLQHRASTA